MLEIEYFADSNLSFTNKVLVWGLAKDHDSTPLSHPFISRGMRSQTN